MTLQLHCSVHNRHRHRCKESGHTLELPLVSGDNLWSNTYRGPNLLYLRLRAEPRILYALSSAAPYSQTANGFLATFLMAALKCIQMPLPDGTARIFSYHFMRWPGFKPPFELHRHSTDLATMPWRKLLNAIFV